MLLLSITFWLQGINTNKLNSRIIYPTKSAKSHCSSSKGGYTRMQKSCSLFFWVFKVALDFFQPSPIYNNNTQQLERREDDILGYHAYLITHELWFMNTNTLYNFDIFLIFIYLWWKHTYNLINCISVHYTIIRNTRDVAILYLINTFRIRKIVYFSLVVNRFF